MNRPGRKPSIVRKLATGNVIATGAVLALAGLVLGIYDYRAQRDALLTNLSTQTEIVAANSASALLFNDQKQAESTLGALRAAPNIVAAEIADGQGRPIARFDRAAGVEQAFSLTVAAGQAEVHRFEDEALVLTRRIIFQDKEIGVVSIASDYEDLNRRRWQFIAAVIAVLLGSISAALFVSWRSQRSITAPLVALATTANRVSVEKDYSVRVSESATAHELVVLTEAFNHMLTEIEQRDQSLLDARNKLEQRVEARTTELDHANKELEAFSYSVSHDLRAPLRHVVGFARLLEEHAEQGLDERGTKYLKTITNAATKMAQLIDDLLAFSRMGREQLAKRKVNLNDLVRDARQEVMALDGNDRRDVAWSVADLPPVDADPAMLRLVLLNLLSNALKYSAPRAKTEIDIGVNGTQPGEVVLYVRDNGVGFDMLYADKLFGVFQRLHRSDQFEGTGIGLANVKRIIHRHGGRVWAESEPDHGATFYFSLPENAQKGRPA